MIRGSTQLIAHIGYPTDTFKSPMIYNPWFWREKVDAVVVPMGCRAEAFAPLLKSVFSLTNIRGAIITMPYKVVAAGLVHELGAAAKVAGACNAIRMVDGRLQGELFDGEGFVRGARRKGAKLQGAKVLVVGAGGVGSAIAASLAQAGAAHLSLFDTVASSAEGLASRLKQQYPDLQVATGSKDPAGHDLVVNATPLGMNPGDPLPIDASRLEAGTFVGEVVLKDEVTPFLQAARARGCRIQVGLDMLFEQIPAYLEYFGFPAATAEELRAVARLD